MNNRLNGNRFELELSRKLAENGFWVHVLQQNKAGQPADIIAVKGRYHTLIDCKVCNEFSFPFSRVEENQKFAMARFFSRCEEVCWFALRLPDDTIRMLSSLTISRLEKNGKKSLSGDELIRRSNELETWLHYAEVQGYK